jgi:hypothetical protein
MMLGGRDESMEEETSGDASMEEETGRWKTNEQV